MGLFQEFREFAVRGNVVDLAVGIIIGAAFNGIVQALVNGVIMPPVGLLAGGVDFAELRWVLVAENPATEAVEEVAIQYGAFINTLVQFLIVAFAVFLLVKGVNHMRRKQAAEPGPAAPPAPTPTEVLLTEIRDALKARPGV
ncbi:MAG: large-conductance mechanosensitive channel protein MscL [Brevundimonas sp.]